MGHRRARGHRQDRRLRRSLGARLQPRRPRRERPHPPQRRDALAPRRRRQQGEPRRAHRLDAAGGGRRDRRSLRPSALGSLVSFRGNTTQLRELRRKLEILRGPETRTRLSKVMGNAAHKQLMDGFREGRDPYGSPWAPLARNRARNRRKGGTSKPLLDTGRMRRSFTVNATPSGFTLWTKTKYARYHQYGTNGRRAASSRVQAHRYGRFISKREAGKKSRKGAVHLMVGLRHLNFKAGGGKIPQRMMIPDSSGLGTWAPPMREAATRFFSRIFKRL
ncbi:MAG: hypothetical protein EOO70_06120 [Myxococcaceae bacterium]|nr:MAG: hypothetical protein EOO70_06120 [Myxococcaceae bacterium]